MAFGHGDGAFETQEIGQVEHEHVQHVAFDPLTAVAEFLSQAGDVNINCTIRYRYVSSQRMINKLIARIYAAGMSGQELQ